jgi:hypothetical protein
MCDVSCVYTEKELAELTPKARAALQKELTKQIRASPEIRVIQDAHLAANKILKEKLRGTLGKLKKG